MKSEITDLEAENIRLQKKCEYLNSMVQVNDDTPRRTELRKRIILESPAPEISRTPVSLKVHKIMLDTINILVFKLKHSILYV